MRDHNYRKPRRRQAVRNPENDLLSEAFANVAAAIALFLFVSALFL